MRHSRAGRALALLLGSATVLPASAEFSGGFTSPDDAAQVNERTVGVVLERNELFFDLIEDIESSLNLSAGLRIVPIVGKNHVQNVYDLLYLDGVDLALVRSDSIEYVRRVSGLAGTRDLTRNVALIGNEKIVVVAREGITTLEALAGRPIGFGGAGSGAFVTGTLLFDSMGIEVEKIEAEGEDALEKVRSGELAAMVHLLDSPGAFPTGTGAAADDPTDGLHVLALPPDERLTALYRGTTLDASDLPGLIGPREPVSSYSVDVNLVAYSWRSPNDRTRRLDRFVESLVERLDELQGDAFQPEWEAVSLEADTPNLDGSPTVERALAEREAALERWHRTRIAAREAEGDEQAVYVEESLPGGGTIIRRREDTPPERAASRLDRLFDELDALLAPAAPDERPGEAPGGEGDGGTAWRMPGVTLPGTHRPGS